MKALKENGKIAWNFAASGTCLTFNEIAGTVMELPEYQTYFTDFIWPWTMLSKKEYEGDRPIYDGVDPTHRPARKTVGGETFAEPARENRHGRKDHRRHSTK